MKNEINTVIVNDLSQNIDPELSMKETKNHLAKLKEAIMNAALMVAIIGYELCWFKESKRYVFLGFNTFEDFAFNQFNLARATAYNYISVFQKCTNYTNENNEPLIEMKEEYKDFSSSQLFEIAKLKDEEKDDILPKLSPTMTVREMKKTIKDIKNVPMNNETTGVSAENVKDKKSSCVEGNGAAEKEVIDSQSRNVIQVEGATWEDIISAKTQKAFSRILELETADSNLFIEIVVSHVTTA